MALYFIDQLALVEVLIFFAAVVLTYAGVLAWFAIRQNDPGRVRGVLKGAAVPVGAVGAASFILAIWGEMTWNYPNVFNMGGDNILFTDVVLMFSMVMIAFAVSAFLSLRMQYVGVFALAAGAVTMFYGWTGYGYSYTREPFDFLLLYLAFGAAGISALPATITLDYYLGTVAGSEDRWRSALRSPRARRIAMDARAVQNLGVRGTGDGTSPSSSVFPLRFRVPMALNFLILAFPVFMALAGFAALWFLQTTLPGHLTPGATP